MPDIGIDDFNPDEASTVYSEEQAEIHREQDAGALGDIDADHPFPPTRYDS